MAVILRVDVAALQEVGLLFAIHARRDVTQRMRIRIDKAMARSNVARRTHTDKTQPRATRMRFVDALMQFRQRVADVRKAVMLAAKREVAVLESQFAKLLQHAIHAAGFNRI
jgi:hypothetical protein